MTTKNSSTQKLVQHTFNNRKILQRKEDGYLFATDMCKVAGKRVNHYKHNAQTKDYLEALSKDTGIPASKLIQIERGRNRHQGTWVHPKVAVHLAQWLSPEFAVQVSSWIFDWMNGKVDKPINNPDLIVLHKSVLEKTGSAIVTIEDGMQTARPVEPNSQIYITIMKDGQAPTMMPVSR